MAEKEIWYHPTTSRKEAEAKLIQSEKDGAFLVRKSDTVEGAYVLSLHMARVIHHYRIRLDADGLFVTVNYNKPSVNSMKFESLTAVIKYLTQNPNSQIKMAGPLCHPIPPDTTEVYFSDDSDEEEDDEEQDEAIKRCPADLRHSLKKPHGSNPTMMVLQSAFQSLNCDSLSEHDPEFVTLLKRYVDSKSAFYDIQKGDSGDRGCLEDLIDHSCRELVKQLKLFNMKMNFLDRFISNIAKESELDPGLSDLTPHLEEEQLETVDTALFASSGISKTIHSKINNVFTHLSRSIKVEKECLINDIKTFEGKEGARGRIQLVVDPRKGTLCFGKPGTEYFHRQIKRLEKSYKDVNKMTILFEDRKKRDVIFDDTRVREEFFQTISQIKLIHQSESEVKNISVFCGTWNMGEEQLPDDIIRLFDESGDYIMGSTSSSQTAYDIYAIGSQEANATEKDWVSSVSKGLASKYPSVQYNHVVTQTLLGMRITVLAKSEHINKISSVESASVKTGVGGMVGNKGAVAVSFSFGATNIAFVCCHLAARSERKVKRNTMYHDIYRQLHLGKKSKFSSFDISFRFDHLFWMGDLNYRLDCEYSEVLSRIRSKEYSALLNYDQLKTEQGHGKVLRKFKEGTIAFPPTYRYERGARGTYVYEKVKATGNVYNVPSYTDRVLLHSLPHLGHTQTGYFSNLFLSSSDHAPVLATYILDAKPQYVAASKYSPQLEDFLKIRFPIIQAKIKLSTPDKLCLKFVSCLLEGSPMSKPVPRIVADYNEDLKLSSPSLCSLSKCDVSSWECGELPELDPILRKMEYIANEYIFVQAVSCGNDSVCYGQGILSLKDKIKSDSIHSFNIVLTLNDEICGEIRGKVCFSRNPAREANLTFSDQLANPHIPSVINL